jgi:polynucleotide 5'-kinase involved in rRNA processing
MLPMLVNAARLIQAARDAGAQTIMYDTSGFVDPAQGGASFKLAKIELLRPALIVAIQRGQELEALLAPLRRDRRARLFELTPSRAVQPRDMATRQAYRASQFARYFRGARACALDYRRWAVWPAPRFQFQQLVALEDGEGFTLELGIVLSADAQTRRVTLLTPLASQKNVEALRLGDVTLDPQTLRDQPLRET